jgi:hypothetical protein
MEVYEPAAAKVVDADVTVIEPREVDPTSNRKVAPALLMVEVPSVKMPISTRVISLGHRIIGMSAMSAPAPKSAVLCKAICVLAESAKTLGVIIVNPSRK